MCKKTNYKSSNTHIDKCIRSLVNFLSGNHWLTVASCCGHGKYPVTVVIKYDEYTYKEVFTFTVIPRTRRFYKRDSEGYYFIPELVNSR